MKAAAARAVLACLAGLPLPGRAAFLGPAAGAYGSGLGAGAAVGAERAGFGGTPAALRPMASGVLLHFHRPFGMAELEVLEASIFRDYRRAGFAILWRQTEAGGLWLEQGIEAQAARRWGAAGAFPGALDAGAAFSAWSGGIPGRAARASLRQGYGLLWSPIPGLRIGAMARGLPVGVPPPGGWKGAWYGDWQAAWEDAGTAWQFGLEAAAPAAGGREPRQALRLEFRKSGPAEWCPLAALAFRPHPALEASAGMASAPFRAALGLRLRWSGLELHEAWRHHRFLGAGWLATLAWTRFRGD